MLNTRFFSILIAAVVCIGCKAQLSVDTILHNITLVNVGDGSMSTGQALLVKDGMIYEIIPENRIRDFTADVTIDGDGGYLIPALADAHVHLDSPTELQNFTRYGVGLVVNMSGGLKHLNLREAVASGELLGPSILTVGPTLDGDPPTNPLFTSVDPESAADVVSWIHKQGYDAVKIYQQMDAETLEAVISAAQDHGLLVIGHVSRTAGIDAAIQAGQRFIAHGEELAFESFDETSRRYDLDSVPALAEMLVQNQVTVTPMLRYLLDIPNQVSDLENYLDSDDMRLLPAAMRMSFDRRQGWFSNREQPEAFVGQIEILANFVAKLSVELQDRDASLILGTDAGFGGAAPGISVHQELEALVDAGFSPLAALQTATLHMDSYLSALGTTENRQGQTKPGYVASLLLIGGSPLEDITATQDIRGVMMAGRWIPQDELTTLEQSLIDRQQTLLPLARALEGAIVGGDPEAAQEVVESRPAEFANEVLIRADNCIFLGYRHYYGGRRPIARRIYELCAKMHPESAPLWIHIARAYESEDDISAAIGAYDRAQELNPWYGDPRSALDRLSQETPKETN